MAKWLLAPALLLVGLAVLFAQEREGDFTIRFEPTAKLQTGAQVPFQIVVKDPLRKLLPHAQVKLQIESSDGSVVEDFPAPEVQAGTYIAKPVFPSRGDWSVYVQVRRDGAMSARTIQFQVPE